MTRLTSEQVATNAQFIEKLRTKRINVGSDVSFRDVEKLIYLYNDLLRDREEMENHNIELRIRANTRRAILQHIGDAVSFDGSQEDFDGIKDTVRTKVAALEQENERLRREAESDRKAYVQVSNEDDEMISRLADKLSLYSQSHMKDCDCEQCKLLAQVAAV